MARSRICFLLLFLCSTAQAIRAPKGTDQTMLPAKPKYSTDRLLVRLELFFQSKKATQNDPMLTEINDFFAMVFDYFRQKFLNHEPIKDSDMNDYLVAKKFLEDMKILFKRYGRLHSSSEKYFYKQDSDLDAISKLMKNAPFRNFQKH